MNISRAEQGDLSRILAIQKEAYLSEAAIYDDNSLPPLTQSIEEIESEFESKVFLKVEIRDVIVGSVRAHLSGNTCLIGRLIVDTGYQRQGIGSALLIRCESIFEAANRFELFTGTKSAGNIRLYERHGYVAFKEDRISPRLTLLYMEKLKKADQIRSETPR